MRYSENINHIAITTTYRKNFNHIAITTIIGKIFIFLKRERKILKINNRLECCTEAVIRSCSSNQAFLKILQNSQKKDCARVSFLITLHASGLQLHLKRGSCPGVFVNFAKFLRTPFFIEHPWWLLLGVGESISQQPLYFPTSIYRRWCKLNLGP